MCVEEHKAADTWKDYDETDTNSAIISASLNGIAGVAYFVAFALKNTNPDIAAIGAAIMIGTLAGATTLKGFVFDHQYETQQNPRLIDPPAF